MANSLPFPLSPQQVLDPSIMRFMETQNEIGVYDVSFNFKTFFSKTFLFKQENCMIALTLQYYILLILGKSGKDSHYVSNCMSGITFSGLLARKMLHL